MMHNSLFVPLCSPGVKGSEDNSASDKAKTPPTATVTKASFYGPKQGQPDVEETSTANLDNTPTPKNANWDDGSSQQPSTSTEPNPGESWAWG